MKINRRKFVATAAGASLAGLPLCSHGARAAVPPAASPRPASSALRSRYSRLDEILKQPVLKKELFAKPVIIETVELLRLNNSFLCRVSIGRTRTVLVLAPLPVGFSGVSDNAEGSF